MQTVREKFVSLTNIDFSACENVRNRNLAILEASKLKLKSITIGHVATVAYGKPRITNSVCNCCQSTYRVSFLLPDSCLYRLLENLALRVSREGRGRLTVDLSASLATCRYCY